MNPVRAATYRRLIGAVGRAPDRRFSHRDAEAAVRDFRRWYDGRDATVRAHADAVLDTLACESDLTYARLAGAATPEGSAVLAAALGLAAVACDPPPDDGRAADGSRTRGAGVSGYLRRIIDLGPGGVIHPGSAHDYRFHGNRVYFAETRTPWLRLWADWPSLQPDPTVAIDDPASAGAPILEAIDGQIAAACEDGLRVVLMPYRFPAWANDTQELAAQRNTDAEASFAYADRMTAAAWRRYVENGRDPARYNPSRRQLDFRIPPEGVGCG